MLVANSFDLWQRDSFFSAAEEVQESADVLESSYRSWLRGKREGLSANELDELLRELQTALGTAKWQLEEFESAVRLSHGNCRDHSRITRHQQFIVAIESQISRVEDALRGSLNGEGKQPLQWVNLDEDERDDLAMFLSGSLGNSTQSNSRVENLYKKKDLDYAACSTYSSVETNIKMRGTTSLRDDVLINMGSSNCVMELRETEALGTRGDVNCEADGTSSKKRTWVSPNYGKLKIVIPNYDDRVRILIPTAEATPKEKGFRTSSCLPLRGISCINKLFICTSGLNTRMRSPHCLQFSSSMGLVIFLMLSFFLLVPYLVHSNSKQ